MKRWQPDSSVTAEADSFSFITETVTQFLNSANNWLSQLKVAQGS